MDQPDKPTEADAESDRRVANLFLLGVFLVIVGVGAWLAFALDNARKTDDCIAQGRRNCARIDTPSR